MTFQQSEEPGQNLVRILAETFSFFGYITFFESADSCELMEQKSLDLLLFFSHFQLQQPFAKSWRQNDLLLTSVEPPASCGTLSEDNVPLIITEQERTGGSFQPGSARLL